MPDLSIAQQRRIGLVALLYWLAWSLLPPLLSSSLPLDVVESIAWGREWQWGYYKHPPLAPWVLYGFYWLFGSVGPFLLSQLCIALTLWLVWLTGRRLLSPERALLGTLLTMGVAYYTRPALEFNHNIAQMPIWPALAYALLLALQEGKLRHWLLLGLVAGLGLLIKYSVVIALAVLFLYVQVTPQRRVFARIGPWLAMAVMLALLAPHVHWLWQSDWLPMAYTSSRAETSAAYPRLAAFDFFATQLLNHVPLLLILLWAGWRARHRQNQPWRWQLHSVWPTYLLTLALGSGVLVLLLGLATGMRLRDMWGTPMWAFSGLLAAAWLPDDWLAAMRPRLLRALCLWLVVVSLLSGLFLAYGAQWRKRPARTDWPAVALAQQARQTWADLAGAHCPLDSVAGHHWLAGLVATQPPLNSSVLIAGDARYAPWMNLARLEQHGTLWLWQAEHEGRHPSPPPPLEQLGQSPLSPALRQHQGVWHLPWPGRAQAAPLTVHWRAYVPAHCQPGQTAIQPHDNQAP